MTIPYSKQQPPPINQLTNVNISESLADGEVLTYNEATEEWINGTAGGGGGTEIVATDNLRSLNAGTPTGTGNILLGLNAGSANPASNGLVCIGMNALPIASTNISDSVVIGENAGLIATRTNRNVLIGSEVVNSLTINYTDDAVVLGYDAGGSRIANSVVIGSEANKTGYSVRSVIIGQDSARNTLAIDQVIIGTNAKSLNGNINGDNKNVIIGDYGGERHAGGSNVIIGSSAGKGTTNYNCNRATIVGQDACKNSGGKESITAIGQASGYDNAGQNCTYIGKSAGVNGGSFANTIVISAETAGLNPTSANSFFVKPIRNNTGVANALFYDATSGEITYDTAGGGGTEIVATRNLITSALGAGSSLISTGTDNILLGNNAGSSLTSQDGNIMLGYNAGINTINNNNVAIGYESAGGNTNLQNSITIGHYAGEGSTNLTSSVVIGNGAGYQMTNAIGSTFIGSSAGRFKRGNYNVAIGFEALRNNTTSDESVGIGYNAGRNNNGSNVVCIGQKAGETNAGNNSVLIGGGAGQVGGSFTDTIVINAFGSSLNPTQGSSCFINPIRAVDLKIGTDLLYYNSTTKELQRSSTDITKFYANFATTTTFTTAQAPIIFTNAPYNINSAYNTGTGVFTAPINGYYQFNMLYGLGQGENITLNWEVNGIIDKSDVRHSPSGGGSGIRTFETTWMGVLGANDTLEINIFSISGTIHFGTAGEGLRGVYIGK